MTYYEKELAALKRAGRFRERRLYNEDIVDLASNDYLGLAENRTLFEKACERVSREKAHAAKASMLVNGYHRIHREFETALCDANGFESAIVMGSGFNANIAMIESLVRRGDELLLDEKYHASGILAAKLVEGKVTTFSHNDADDLAAKLERSEGRRRIVAAEGIYSMDGDLMNAEIFAVADHYDALLIVDEAHSSGVVGEHLLGVFDLFGIRVRPNHLKMGTLGKAYGSFGAYVLCSSHIESYLINRAKPVIYATAPSLFDTASAHEALGYILENAVSLHQEIAVRQQTVAEYFDIVTDGLIAAIPVGDNRKVMEIRQRLLEAGTLVGAIRPPTVDRAIVRLIPRVPVGTETIASACKTISSLC